MRKSAKMLKLTTERAAIGERLRVRCNKLSNAWPAKLPACVACN